jgi:tetratricopeptide (TPR) repeat protein
VTLLALLLLLQVIRTETRLSLSGITLALVVTSLVSTLPWVWINASETKTVRRVEHLLQMDRERAAHGYEILACHFRDEGDHDRALEVWERAIAIDPTPRYFAALGNAYRRVERYEEAIQAYYRSIQEGGNFPGLPAVYSNLGSTLLRVGRYDEAASQMRKAISLRPDKADYYFNMGNILGKAGRYAEAVPYFETTVRLDPGKMRAYRALGVTLARLGEREKARECLEHYLKSMPEDAPQMRGIIDSIQIDPETDR